MSQLYDTIKAEVTAYIVDVKTQLADGISFADVFPLISGATMRFTRIVQATGATGPEKKEAVLAALEAFYNEAIAPLDLPGVPNLFVEPLVDKTLGSLIRPMLGPLIERVVSEHKAAGTF